MAEVRWSQDRLKQSMKGSGDPALSNKWSFECDNVTINGCNKLDGLSFEVAVVEHQHGEDKVTHYRPGRFMPGKLLVERDFVGSNEFFNWRKKVVDGNTERASVSIVFNSDDAAPTEVKRINCFNCYPTKWEGPKLDAKSSGHATESLTIIFEEMKLG